MVELPAGDRVDSRDAGLPGAPLLSEHPVANSPRQSQVSPRPAIASGPA